MVSRQELEQIPQSEDFKKISNFKGADILSARQFDRENLSVVFEKTETMEGICKKIRQERKFADHLNGYRLATLFYDPSTRTRLSFETAMQNLGGLVISESNTQFSSAIKGELLEDTVRIVELFNTDIIVLRHKEVGSSRIAADSVSIPVINGGDGEGEHPTQALLDLYTIQKECGKIDGITVTMIGDLKYGRTVHSLAYLFSLYNVKINLVSPSFLKMPSDLVEELRGKGVNIDEFTSLDEVTEDYDVLYVTRVQKERINEKELPAIAANLQGFDQHYALTPEIVSKSRAVIMHPLPRVREIPLEIDNFPQAAYFRQVQNGLYVRMAVLALVLGKMQ